MTRLSEYHKSILISQACKTAEIDGDAIPVWHLYTLFLEENQETAASIVNVDGQFVQKTLQETIFRNTTSIRNVQCYVQMTEGNIGNIGAKTVRSSHLNQNDSNGSA